MKHIVFLASSSQTRHSLLEIAQIPYQIISQTADESLVSIDRPLTSVVTDLALLKMDHVIVPQGQYEDQVAFILTADTLTLMGGQLFGKPQDREHAKHMLRIARQGSVTGTAFCVKKIIWRDGRWHDLDMQTGYAEAWTLIDIPENFLDFYLDRIDFLNVSGAIKIRGLCEQFTKEVRGSYSAIMGMPMYQLRETLDAMGFYAAS